MTRVLLNLAKVFFFCIATFAANNVARAGDPPPKICALGNTRDPEVKTVYTGTVQLWRSGGGDANNPRVGWQCFLHNTGSDVSVAMDITTPDGAHAPYYFVSVETDTSQLAGFTMVVVEFYPNCYPNCTTELKFPMGTYTVTFKSQKK